MMSGDDKKVRLERAEALVNEARQLVDGMAPTAHEHLGLALATIRAVLTGRG